MKAFDTEELNSATNTAPVLIADPLTFGVNLPLIVNQVSKLMLEPVFRKIRKAYPSYIDEISFLVNP